MLEQQMGRNMTQHLQETCHTEKPSMGHHWNRILSNSDAILSNGNTHVYNGNTKNTKNRNYTVVVKS